MLAPMPCSVFIQQAVALVLRSMLCCCWCHCPAAAAACIAARGATGLAPAVEDLATYIRNASILVQHCHQSAGTRWRFNIPRENVPSFYRLAVVGGIPIVLCANPSAFK